MELFNELQMLKEIDHPNVMRIHELFKDDHHYYLITEYLAGGELFDRIKRQVYEGEESGRGFSEKDAADLMK